MNYLFLLEGFDPTSLGAGSPTNAQLLQMVHEAQFADDIGGVIWSQTAPDTTTYPILARCRWGKLNGSNQRTGEFYYHDGTSWTLETPKIGTLTGDQFADGSIGIEKLEPGTALYVLRTNAGATAVEWASVASLLAPNTVPLNSLVNAATNGYVLYSGVGGVWAATLFNTVADGWLAITNIPFTNLGDPNNVGAANQVPYLVATGGAAAFGYVDQLLRTGYVAPSKLSLVSLAGKLVKVNSAGTDFEGVDTTYYMRGTRTSAAVEALETALPTGAGDANAVEIEHHLSGTPRFYSLQLKCTDAGGNCGWSYLDVIDISAAMFDTGGGTDFNPGYAIQVNSTHIRIIQPIAAAKKLTNKSTGADDNTFDPTKWRVLISATL